MGGGTDFCKRVPISDGCSYFQYFLPPVIFQKSRVFFGRLLAIFQDKRFSLFNSKILKILILLLFLKHSVSMLIKTGLKRPKNLSCTEHKSIILLAFSEGVYFRPFLKITGHHSGQLLILKGGGVGESQPKGKSKLDTRYNTKHKTIQARVTFIGTACRVNPIPDTRDAGKIDFFDFFSAKAGFIDYR